MFLIRKITKGDKDYTWYRGMVGGVPLYGKIDGAVKFDTRVQAQNTIYDIHTVGESHEIVKCEG